MACPDYRQSGTGIHTSLGISAVHHGYPIIRDPRGFQLTGRAGEQRYLGKVR
ncbi:hypothetical protein BO71DRAFT_401512 [Aspergillus ellipticus CBS 707.79]|uniref:Uncharacterized protein n=1 Tax=Aspergillus ellipticus CBS 707.79 TaxID=1448320 RepID=A0A319D183_9EURO|nr:hypothetical protein BO71DRAFT_401512 [Aspergillus ellipticus CBS 707.79]